jgi:glycosyltransferase involved in cell wall biosynthesis
MKVLHVVYSAPPDPPGGTEIYVAGLSRALAPLGVTSVVSAPGPVDARFEHAGLQVRRFEMQSDHLTVEELYGDGDSLAAAAFGRLLDAENPDVVHQHALTAACSTRLVLEARRRGIPVVFTYHTPAVSCQRGTLLQFGQSPCDGVLDVVTCSACVLDGLGVAATFYRVLSQTPSSLGAAIGRMGLSGGPWTALRMTRLVESRFEEIRAFFERVDRIVVLSEWVSDMLRRNGVSEKRMTLCRHGVEESAAPRAPYASGETLRVVHLGRLDPTKGTLLLAKAVSNIPELEVSLDVYGIAQSANAGAVAAEIRALAAVDPRIRLLDAIPHDEVISTLAGYDLVAIPSQVVETGPLVALEASAAGVPVIASNLGNLRSVVDDGVSGRLVTEYGSVAAWTAAIRQCVTDRAMTSRWRAAVTPPRTMTDVAVEMHALYADVLHRRYDVSPLQVAHD